MRLVLNKSVGVRLSPRPAPHACEIADPQPPRSFDTRRSAVEQQAGRFTSRSFPKSPRPDVPLGRAASSCTLAALAFTRWQAGPHTTPPPRPASDRGRRASSVNPITNDPRHGYRTGRQSKGGINARQGHPGNGPRSQGGRGPGGRIPAAAQAADGCGHGCGAAADRRRRAVRPERGRSRPRRAAAQAVHESQGQAANGTGATSAMATGNEGATDGKGNTTRRKQ